MGALLQILAGPSGKSSSMRVAMLATVLAVMGTWSWVSIRKLELQPIDPELAALVLGMAGVKAFQRKSEGDAVKKEENGHG